MPDFHLASGAWLIFLALGLVVRLVNSQITANRAGADLPTPALMPELAVFGMPVRLPLRRRPVAWWRRQVRGGRDAVDGEWLLDLDAPSIYRLTMPMPRRMLRVDFIFSDPVARPVADIAFTDAVGAVTPAWSGRWKQMGARSRLRLEFTGDTSLTGVAVTLHAGKMVDCDTHVRLVASGEPDARAIVAANIAMRGGDDEEFLRQLEIYEGLCPHNPVTALCLARLHHRREEDTLAEWHALRAMGLKRGDFGAEICRKLAGRRSWTVPEQRLPRLREEAEAWGLSGHHGLVALVSSRSFVLGPGFRRERLDAAVLVRRRVAARKFRSVHVPMVTGWGGLLHTAVQVRRVDGTVDELSDDRFTVGSAPEDNPFIAVARRNAGLWILPDLAPGDIVEYTWDSVKLGEYREESHDAFVLANIGDPDAPTLHASVACLAPAAWKLAAATRNTGPEVGRDRDPHGRWSSATVERERVLPRRSHSDQFPRTSLNPLAAFGRADGDWKRVGRDLLTEHRAAVQAAPEVPPPLAGAYAGLTSPREILARAFYWVRDHIKYASVASAHEFLKSPQRAERLVVAGVGDCKDVSYLLALVCEKCGIPWEFVLLSSENGVVMRDIPAEQFDHVIVRARVDDEWLYLDAAGSSSIFGAPFFPSQGLTGLSGGDESELIIIPDVPASRTRILLRETLDGFDGARLIGHAEIRLEGYPARMVDELWKHQSLVAIDPERSAGEVMHTLLPDFMAEQVSVVRDSAAGDVFHLTAEGSRGRLVQLGGRRVATMFSSASGLLLEHVVHRHFEERFTFPFALEFEYRLELLGPARAAVRELSGVAELRTSFCTVEEERESTPDREVVTRRIVIARRTIDGEDLTRLPAAFERMNEAVRVMAGLSAEGS